MKIDIRKILLVLWLCTGLTLHFSSSSIEVETWTQAYAMDDDDDYYDDCCDDDYDDDDGGYWDGWDINDFEDYILSGDAEEDGIDGHVWDDADDFFENADWDVIDDVFESLDHMGYGDDYISNLIETHSDALANNEGYIEHLIIDIIHASGNGEKGLSYNHATEKGKLFNAIMNQFMDPYSNKNLCVFAIMEYVNNLYGGNVTLEDYLLKDPSQISDILEHGILLKDVAPHVKNEFNTLTGTIGITTAIDNGYVILTDLPSNSENNVHNVVIVGYTNDHVIYMDPEVGVLQKADPDAFNNTYVIVITGLK